MLRDALLSARGGLCVAALRDGTAVIIDQALQLANPSPERISQRTPGLGDIRQFSDSNNIQFMNTKITQQNIGQRVLLVGRAGGFIKDEVRIIELTPSGALAKVQSIDRGNFYWVKTDEEEIFEVLPQVGDNPISEECSLGRLHIGGQGVIAMKEAENAKLRKRLDELLSLAPSLMYSGDVLFMGRHGMPQLATAGAGHDAAVKAIRKAARREEERREEEK
jgi:hypothetical protein